MIALRVFKKKEAELGRAGVTDLLFLFSFHTLTSLPKVGSAQIISILLCISHEESTRLNSNQYGFKRPTLMPRPCRDIRNLPPRSLFSTLNPVGPPTCVSESSSTQCVGSTPLRTWAERYAALPPCADMNLWVGPDKQHSAACAHFGSLGTVTRSCFNPEEVLFCLSNHADNGFQNKSTWGVRWTPIPLKTMNLTLI